MSDRLYAVADVDQNGDLPRDYRSIQWWGVPYGTHTNIPDQDCLLTLDKAVRHAIGSHVAYARAAAKYGDTLPSSPLRPQGVVHVTPDGYKPVAWTWWDDHLGEGYPIIRVQVHGNGQDDPGRYGHHFIIPTDHPELITNVVNRVVEHVNA